MSYKTTIALYEIDDTMDVYTAFPNGHELFLKRAARGEKDDFLGFSNVKILQSQQGEATVEHPFSVRATFEPDQEMELKALVVCVPDTATAMKWSPTRKVRVVNG